jgi:hypothetical protein
MHMDSHKRIRLTGIAIALALSTSIGCLGDAREEDTGELSMELQIAPGVSVSTVNWTINNIETGFMRSGSVPVRFSNTISFQTGALPSGVGYTIALTATSTDGAFTCTGTAGFRVTPFVVTPVTLTLNCSTTPPQQGGIIVIGGTQICSNLDSLGASPLETAVNTPISLSATASVGSLTPTFAWTATDGTFDNPASATPTFTCPATPGPVTITVTVSPGSPSCSTITRQNVVVTCSLQNPTFTNVHANVISVRCTSCHRPGGSGVNVGMLDMSTPAAAYANLIGVPGQGIGAGASGITCASVMPPLVRVVPGNAEGSLLFNKVHSKLVGVQAPCGSPMPLPGGAPSLSAADVDLIARWISAGALND